MAQSTYQRWSPQFPGDVPDPYGEGLTPTGANASPDDPYVPEVPGEPPMAPPPQQTALPPSVSLSPQTPPDNIDYPYVPVGGPLPRANRRQWLLGHQPSPIPPPVNAANGAMQIPNAPVPRTPGILQRIGAAAIGAGAGYVNAARRTQIDPSTIAAAEQGILHPGFGAQQRAYANTVQQMQTQAQMNAEAAKEKAELENAASQKEYREGSVEQRKIDATTRAAAPRERAKLATSTQNEKLEQAMLRPWGDDAQLQKERDPVPLGMEVTQSLTQPGMVWIHPPRMVPMAADLVPYAPGRKAGELVPYSEWKKAQQTAGEAAKGAAIAEANSVFRTGNPSAESEKIKFQGIISKLDAEGKLPPNYMSDPVALARAIDASRTLTPQEKHDAKGYQGANTTPAATSQAGILRIEALGGTREMPVIDTQNGNSLQYLSATDINKANKEQPGRYIPTGPGTAALNKTALLEDIRGSISQTRQSLASIPEFTAGDKVLIATAMRDRDPRSAISQLIGGVAGGHMTPQQQEYLINLAQLHEQALAMRSVLGAGQGSEDLRAAVLRTIPGPGTPNKAYAAKQLDAFEQTLNRLSRGVPKVPLRDQQLAAPQPQANPNPNGYVKGHVYGGLTYLGGDPNNKASWK